MRKTATFITQLTGLTGYAELYKVTPPCRDADGNAHEFIVVSSPYAHGHPETLIFPASQEGKVQDWCNLEESQEGTLDHRKVLRDGGWTVVRQPAEEIMTRRLRECACKAKGRMGK